jgi:hypothetical protein
VYEKNSRVGGIAKERETGDKKRKERGGKRGEGKRRGFRSSLNTGIRKQIKDFMAIVNTAS